MRPSQNFEEKYDFDLGGLIFPCFKDYAFEGIHFSSNYNVGVKALKMLFINILPP